MARCTVMTTPSTPAAIGTAPWADIEDFSSLLEEFATIYETRPVRDNRGGMRAPHMFATWLIARLLAPELIVESGIWKGQSTWLLETACPDANIVSIDINLSYRQYISPRATYHNRDFALLDWSQIPENSLAFFDDHQNAFQRLRQCRWFGFRHVIFEDNYPSSQGDCYSIKKAFAGAGFRPAASQHRHSLITRVKAALLTLSGSDNVTIGAENTLRRLAEVPANQHDARILAKHLDVLHEFPPVFKTAQTRWGDAWDQTTYPTLPPLLDKVTHPSQQVYLDEADSYNWICYARLK